MTAAPRSFPPPPASSAPRKRAAAVRSSTILERFTCPFDIHEFARTGDRQLTELARTLGMNGSNFHNWRKAIPGHAPLSVAKALMISYLPDHLAEFEATIDGKIARRGVALRISAETAQLARSYDAQRAGVRLGMVSGEVYIIPTHPPESAASPILGHIAHADDTAPAPAIETPVLAEDEIRASQHIPEMDPAFISSAISAALTAPAGLPEPSNTFDIPTPQGMVRVTLPAQSAISPGEREVFTAILLRANVQLTEVFRRNGELEIQNRALEQQAAGLRGRVKELVDANRELIERSRDNAAKGVHAVTTATKPTIATPKDIDTVRAAIKQAPELERILTSIESEIRTAHSQGASSGFTPGAASAASLH